MPAGAPPLPLRVSVYFPARPWDRNPGSPGPCTAAGARGHWTREEGPARGHTGPGPAGVPAPGTRGNARTCLAPPSQVLPPPGAARRARCRGGPSAAAPGRTRGSSRTHVAEAHHRLPFCPCPGCPEVPGIRPRPGYNPNPPRDSQAPSRRYPPSAPPGSHPRPPGCLRGPRRPQSPLPEAGPGARSAQVRGRCRGRGRGASW